MRKRPDVSERNRQRRGDQSPRWKGNEIKPASGRHRAQRTIPCPEGKERHHKDGNTSNNNPENIGFLTRKEHMITDGRIVSIQRNLQDRTGIKHTDETKHKIADKARTWNRPRDNFGRYRKLGVSREEGEPSNLYSCSTNDPSSLNLE
jgi:hypothetical protein